MNVALLYEIAVVIGLVVLFGMLTVAYACIVRAALMDREAGDDLGDEDRIQIRGGHRR